MSIKRSKALAEFFVMHNATAQDKNLSWAARGMLTYLLSKPEGWSTSMADLTRQTSAGRDACKAAFKELERTGYATRQKSKGAGGRYIWDTIITDRPSMGEPSMDRRSMVNTSIYKEQSLERTDIERTESKDSLSVSKKNRRQTYSEDFEVFWKQWEPNKTPAGNKKEAYNEWQREVDQPLEILLEKSIQYCQQCQATDTNTKHVCRWLKYRGWEQDYEVQADGHDMVMAALEEKWRREEEAERETNDHTSIKAPNTGSGDSPTQTTLSFPLGQRQKSH